MTLDGLQKAWARPAVRKLAADVAADYVRGVEERMPLLRARAIEAAARLMEGGRSDAVRMRAIEAVMGGRTVSQPITPAATDPADASVGGYLYTKPGTEPIGG